MTDESARSRRRFLAALATTPALAGAGCLGTGSTGPGDSMGTDAHSGDTTAESTATPTSNETTAESHAEATSTVSPTHERSSETALSHAAARDAGNEPTLGPPPGEGKATIIAYEDPSCHACREFETGPFEKLRTELVEPGDLSFVYRTFPHVQAWAMPATRALEATYAHDAEAFWQLKTYFYEEQGSFSTRNVYSKVDAFLQAETSVDAGVVVADAKAGKHDAAIQSDMAVVEEVGMKYTPMFFLYRDGEYRSNAVGSQSYSVFKNALGL